jgi:hypothetical protein
MLGCLRAVPLDGGRACDFALILDVSVLEYDTQRDKPQLKFVVFLKASFISFLRIRSGEFESSVCLLCNNLNPTHRSWEKASSKMCDPACCD